MDPQYRKFMCDQPPSESPTEDKSEKIHPETTDMPVSESEGGNYFLCIEKCNFEQKNISKFLSNRCCTKYALIIN